ncbi:unnamed protein product [Lactuca virosa]|uniref:Uncharacterized protein n=1 Tax=Lactuca virosa TaxID=75947 RepID=A0AAU9NTN7_9ASTR|nr:unnamed protein product [Lactuca virosa]
MHHRTPSLSRRRGSTRIYCLVRDSQASSEDTDEDRKDDEEAAEEYDVVHVFGQWLAIQAFLRGSSVVVSITTSTNKILIVEAAIVVTAARGRTLFYATPFKVLSNQKFRTFGEDNVGLLTGDSAINRDAQVVIILLNMIKFHIARRLFEAFLGKQEWLPLTLIHNYFSNFERFDWFINIHGDINLTKREVSVLKLSIRISL